MFIIYGFYRFAQKRIGYRSDFCLTCNAERIAEQWHAFNVGHLCFVPFVPLGAYKRWICPTCHNNPHVDAGLELDWPAGVARALETFSAASFLGAVWVTLLKLKDPEGGMEPSPFWVMTLVIGLFYVPFYWIRYRKREALGLGEKLQQVQAASLTTCPFCNGNLNSSAFCDSCQVQRHEVLEQNPI